MTRHLGQEPKSQTRRRYPDRDRCSIVVRDRRNEDGVAEEELAVKSIGVRIFWILEPNRVENRDSIHVRLVESSVEIVK